MLSPSKVIAKAAVYLAGANQDRVSEIENQIGAGLIEEVIQVAQGELKLVDEMAKHKV